MSDWTLPPRSVCIVGMTGSGKTTFAFRYLLNAPACCRFVFDDLGQTSARLHLPHSATAWEVEAALQTKWVIFNPHRMFPGRLKDAFRWFCKWSFDASCRGRGRKIFFADEVWRFQDRDDIPLELAQLSQMGRAENLELVTATQRPSCVNASITGSATELVAFRLQESVELRKVRELGISADLSQFPPGKFAALNRISGRMVLGSVFTPAK